MVTASEAVRQLNRLAKDWEAGEAVSEDDTRKPVRMYCEVLNTRLKEPIEALATQPVTWPAAEIVTLSQVTTANGEMLTSKAIALAVTAEGSPFGRIGNQHPPLTEADVEQVKKQVQSKVGEPDELIWLPVDSPEKFDDSSKQELDAATDQRRAGHSPVVTHSDAVTTKGDETVVGVSLDDVIDAVLAEFDYIASITVHHFASHEEPGALDIKVYTGEADGGEDYRSLLPPDHEVEITKVNEAFTVPVSVMATTGGPVEWDSPRATTIYMADNVHGAEPLPLADGLAYLMDKLECPDVWSSEHWAAIEHIQGYAE